MDILLSIIIPIYNEEKYIGHLLESITGINSVNKEFFLVDGGSTDGTLEIIDKHKRQNENIHLIHNPERFVSHGFNKAFPLTKGKYITLLGAHAIYPNSFFETGIPYLESGECDVVGGPLQQLGKTETGQAIAYCMSSKFGVGGSEFRTETKKMYVDSVAFAIYKRAVFEKTGLLDEELIRNQDDELHYRINAAGFRILMVPEMRCSYYVRNNLKSLFRQYFQYGLYKPLVLKKVHSGIRLRHLIPAIFCLYIISIPIVGWFSSWIVPLALYSALALYFSIVKSDTLTGKQKLICLIIFPTLHISYGSGFIIGLKKNYINWPYHTVSNAETCNVTRQTCGERDAEIITRNDEAQEVLKFLDLIEWFLSLTSI